MSKNESVCKICGEVEMVLDKNYKKVPYKPSQDAKWFTCCSCIHKKGEKVDDPTIERGTGQLHSVGVSEETEKPVLWLRS